MRYIIAILLSLSTFANVYASDSPIMMAIDPDHYPIIESAMCESSSGVRILATSIHSAHTQYGGTGNLYLLAKETEFAPEQKILLSGGLVIGDIITVSHTINIYYSNEVALDVTWNDGFESDLYVSGISWTGQCPSPRNEEEIDEPLRTFFIHMPFIMR